MTDAAPRSARQHAQGALAAAAIAAFAAAAALPASAAEMAVTVDGERLAPEEVIGRTVTTADGEKIGTVIDLIGRENTYNDVVVRLDPEHRQMGLVLGAEAPRTEGTQPPVVLGGSTVAMRAESLGMSDGGKALTVAEAALVTVREGVVRWSDLNGGGG